jgi:large subunit ribosomal protein L25
MKFEIDVQKREQAGKGVARQLRREGRIPAVLYGNGQSLLLSMDPKVARRIILSQAGHTGLLTVRIGDGVHQEERVAVLQDHQVDPITGAVLHVDLFEVSMDKSLRVKVPVTIIGGVPAGVKEGGSLHQPLRELHIECLPTQIPDHVEINTESLEIGQGIRVQDVNIPAGVKVLEDGGVMVAHVTAKISEAKLEALLTRTTEEGAPEGGPPAAEKAKVAEPTSEEAPAESKLKEEKK